MAHKVKIKSCGNETCEVMLDGGSIIPRMTRVTFEQDWKHRGIPHAVIELVMVEADVKCEADIFVTTLPNGKKYMLVPMAREKENESDICSNMK